MNKPLHLLPLFCALSLLVPLGCSSSSPPPPAPVISDFTMPSSIAAGTASVTGSLLVSDPEGLAGLTMNVTISGGGFNNTASTPVSGGSASETTATLQQEFQLTGVPAGTYEVSISVTETGETSNSLSATVVVE
jgi:hypothetical protein